MKPRQKLIRIRQGGKKLDVLRKQGIPWHPLIPGMQFLQEQSHLLVLIDWIFFFRAALMVDTVAGVPYFLNGLPIVTAAAVPM